MSLYKNIIYPTLTYAERQLGLVNTKTYNALVLSFISASGTTPLVKKP